MDRQNRYRETVRKQRLNKRRAETEREREREIEEEI